MGAGESRMKEDYFSCRGKLPLIVMLHIPVQRIRCTVRERVRVVLWYYSYILRGSNRASKVRVRFSASTINL